MSSRPMKNIVLFASGSGSNVENIIRYFRGNPNITVAAVFANKRNAKVLDRCDVLKVNALYFNRPAFHENDLVRDILKSIDPDLIVLAGFLWKIPKNIIQAFPDKIINIHPALLPKYGGKGMYGSKVHEAVKANRETETGITIHYVNENYDEGSIIHQEKVAISSEDNPDTIAAKVHKLEYEHYPQVIEKLVMKG